MKKSDFEVMEALTSDSILTTNPSSSGPPKQLRKSNFLSWKLILHNYLLLILATSDTDLSRSPPGSYEQNWPPTNREEFSPTDKPPFLPPHLLNIILNKDTAAHVIDFERSKISSELLFLFSTNQRSYPNQITWCWNTCTLFLFA